MSHDHHDHRSLGITSLNKAFVIGIVLNAGFVVAEFIAGFWYNSLGLISDAGHNLVSLLNAVILLVAVGFILGESIDKLFHPRPVDGDAVAWVAGVGVLVNALTAWLFVKDKEKDLNVKGAYLHMAADALVSVGVVVSGIVIQHTGWYMMDPFIPPGDYCAIVFVCRWTGCLRESAMTGSGRLFQLLPGWIVSITCISGG